MLNFCTKSSAPGTYTMKPSYTYSWTTVFLSPNVISGKLKEASRVRSHDFNRFLDSNVNLNMVEPAMRQMPWKTVAYFLCTITSFLEDCKS